MSGVDQCPLFGVERCLVCRGFISVHCLELRGVFSEVQNVLVLW